MWRRTVLLSAVAGALSACGFRLRGAANLPAYALHVTGSLGPVANGLINHLQRGKVAVSANGGAQPAQANAYSLVVLDDQRIRNVQGTNTSGQVREIKLRVQFRWTLLDAKNNEVLPPRSSTYEQDLSFSESQVLGKTEEEAAVFETLQARTINNVMSQLARIKP